MDGALASLRRGAVDSADRIPMGRRSDIPPELEARAFTAPRRLPVRRIVETAAGKLAVSMHAGQPAHVRYLDTFDRRLRRAGVVLEHVAFAGGGGGGRLRYRELGSAAALADAPAAAPPAFAHEIAHARLRALLSPLIDVRRLLAVAETRGRLTAARCRDREGKVVLDVECFTTRRGPARITVRPLRGYERFAGRAARRIRGMEGVAPEGEEPMLSASEGPDAAFGGMAAPGRVDLDPGERSDAACKRVLAALDAVMEMNAPAVEADLDPECLHDFRVAVRKARSLLGEMKHVFAPGVTRRLRSDLGWLGQCTGPVRDLDVHLLTLGPVPRGDGEGRASDGGEGRDPMETDGALAALRGYLEAAREREYRALSRTLRSARYRRVRSTFRTFAEREPPARPRCANALVPIAALSAARILKVYHHTLAEGRAIGDASPPESLHELRKSCKRLRYLLEFFRGIHRAKPVERTIARLKQFQDHLGAYQDLQVQRAVLRAFREKHAQGTLPGAVRPGTAGFGVIDDLCAELAGREREVRAGFAARFARYDSKRAHEKLAAALGRGPE